MVIFQARIEDNYDEGGLFFDIHGHGHPNVWAELGYLISGANLDNDILQPESSSIYHLSQRTGDASLNVQANHTVRLLSIFLSTEFK